MKTRNPFEPVRVTKLEMLADIGLALAIGIGGAAFFVYWLSV
jgi:hypothetical protein